MRQAIDGPAIVLITLAAVLGVSVVESRADVVQYEVLFEATWSAETHPEDFPPNPHFSGLIGGTHNDGVTFWEVGELASPGIEAMAETGAKSPLSAEIDAAINAGTAFSLISGGGINPSPGSVSQAFEIDSTHPLVTLVAMIAPSPDWFVGVSEVSLYEDGAWLEELVVDLPPYDAGTDSGTRYGSPNQDTEPPEPIAEISGRYPFQGTPPLGTFTFRLISEPCSGDLDGDGNTGQGDLGILLASFGIDDGGDLDGDGYTDQVDLGILLGDWGCGG